MSHKKAQETQEAEKGQETCLSSVLFCFLSLILLVPFVSLVPLCG